MLRITVEKTEAKILFILEGSLSGPWVAELHKTIIGSRSQPDVIKLDLSRVHFADEQGLLLIRESMAWGVTLWAASPYIKELLKQGL